LPPHSVYSWVDLKTKFMQAFQMFHDTTAEASDLYNCKQKDKRATAELREKVHAAEIPNPRS
jgi:hypothetical protein